MAYGKRPGSGTLFTNDKKQKDSHPDRQGDALIHCPQCSHNFEVKLAGWIKDGRNGKFLSMKIESKEDPGAHRPGEREREQRYDKIANGVNNPRMPGTPVPDDDAGDDIPF